jgi:hypothetical protein
MPFTERLQAVDIDFDSADGEASLGRPHREREADIPLTDDDHRRSAA